MQSLPLSLQNDFSFLSTYSFASSSSAFSHPAVALPPFSSSLSSSSSSAPSSLFPIISSLSSSSSSSSPSSFSSSSSFSFSFPQTKPTNRIHLLNEGVCFAIVAVPYRIHSNAIQHGASLSHHQRLFSPHLEVEENGKAEGEREREREREGEGEGEEEV
ncbi:uncharacterized protein MONOS_11866 [Monocercomonoides exilis]|uniref:uncharacterized protein n=1 Tax=Monocercomonoides exilis TaxID=2049356 RepID=UPI003559A5A4|nr:hypothetical protein MONOS_11866 [Monocercomonoides exilis]|eukprot:MONOS_11866.1-p1 / transcript=MONOS_11866.1 / gene=MONOS_11866 / organism=Monocercomonoides_exilis_PA203 / gene_product=unspecified product / transcript_product=unspecified product / location=Mono_scaffold00620:4920-5396(+) / protein_length=159 / sequence_SO=supercontig / SO=protein_coding / is_pseudo=false